MVCPCCAPTPLGWTQSVMVYFTDYTDTREAVRLRVDANDDWNGNLITAIQGITLANIPYRLVQWHEGANGLTQLPPYLPTAQHGIRWTVRYTDTVTGDKHRLTIPCANLDLLTGGSEELDITTVDSPGKILADTLESEMVSPVGNAIQVDRVELD